MMVLQVIGGLLLLLAGAEVLVRGAVGIARRYGVSPLVIGMTVVAFGTSAPELVVSLDGALSGSAGIAVGNIVGSNIANLLLIIGITALCRPIAAHSRPLLHDGLLLLAASAGFALLAWSGRIEHGGGLLLLAAFVGVMISVYWRKVRGGGDVIAESREREAAELADLSGWSWLPWLAAALGLGALLFGADLLVEGGVKVARAAGVSEAVIGLTLIAVGTSLPELAASVVAGMRGHAEVAVGNVLGSNLFNMLFVGGAVAAVVPLPVDAQIRGFDIWVMLAATAAFLPLLLGGRFGRVAALAFLLAYAGYIALQARGVSAVIPWLS